MSALSAFLTGFLATSYQIFLLREFSVQFYGNELTFGFVMASWLLWGGLGSLGAARLNIPREKLGRVFVAIVILFLAALVALRFSRFALGLHPGELTGMAPALLFSLILCALAGFPLGVLFVLNARAAGGNVPRVYGLEALGATIGALLADFGLVPFVSNWQGVAIVSAVGIVSWALFSGSRNKTIRLVALLAFLAAFAAFDAPAQRICWKPFSLLRTMDTPYGRLQLVGREGQLSLYSNGLPVFTVPDIPAAEESVHFAMLQRPEAGKALLIGGGLGGGLEEFLKYPYVRVDYVELDPAILRFIGDRLPLPEKQVLESDRIRIFFQDGRAYLQGSDARYDVILLCLPEPASAQINRFYTEEFFRQVKEHLVSGGVFSFIVPSAENYISPELGEYLASLHATLCGVFSKVRVVPGDSNIFLASEADLTLDSEELARRIREHEIRTITLTPKYLSSRLDPLRTSALDARISLPAERINRDLSPSGYYFHSILRSSSFRKIESGILKTFARLPSGLLLDVPLLFYVLILAFLLLRGRRAEMPSRVPLWTMGFTSIVVELLLVIVYQTAHGYVYGKLSLLLAAFMAGTALGALLGIVKKEAHTSDILIPQGGFIILIACLERGLEGRIPEAVFFLALLGFGGLGGFLFVISSRLAPSSSHDYGSGYGADLLGSFLGALSVSAIILPLAGAASLLERLLLMNSFCFLFLFVRSKSSARKRP